MDEDTNLEKFAEEWGIPLTEELKSLEIWGHRHSNILKAGRSSHVDPIWIPEDERDGFMADLLEKDPVVDRYRGINEDQPLPGQGENPPWLSKVVGDT